jgi:hypothetical protein
MDKVILKVIFAVLLVVALVAITKPSSSPSKTPAEEGLGYGDEETPTYSRYEAKKEVLPEAALIPAKVEGPSPALLESLQKLKSSLPLQGQLKFKSAEAAHRIHPAVLQAGVELGHLKELWISQPANRPLAYEFYEDCTFNDRLVESVRALCYLNAVEISTYLKKTDQVLAWTVNERVQSLASRMMVER